MGMNQRTLAKTAEWPTHGIDPHELMLDAGGRLIVANGGITTQPETGRAKLQLQAMDSSLVCLETGRGECTGQWRLQDQRLSLRHLARLAQGPGRALTGVALQAQHDDPAAQAAAPVLALFDGQRLTAVVPPEPLAGYAGDIAALPNGFVLSCPRAHRLVVWQADGTWAPPLALAEACALAPSPSGAPESLAASPAHPRHDESPAFSQAHVAMPRCLTPGGGNVEDTSWGGSWAAGRGQGCAVRPDAPAPRYAIEARCRIDNHWVLAAG